jgi:hypothetical protein
VRQPQSRRTRETIVVYRQVFGKDEASRVALVWLLERCGLLKRIENDEQRVLHNWGIELLENMGLTQGINYRALVDAALRLGIPKEAIDEEKE